MEPTPKLLLTDSVLEVTNRKLKVGEMDAHCVSRLPPFRILELLHSADEKHLKLLKHYFAEIWTFNGRIDDHYFHYLVVGPVYIAWNHLDNVENF